MRNEYLDRLVSGCETDVRGQLNRLLTNSPARNHLYSELGHLISAHLRLDDDWNPNDQWIDATGFLETETLSPETLHITGYFNWGYLPEVSNHNYAPLDATLTLHPNGQLDYDIRFTIEGRPRCIRPDGIFVPTTPNDDPASPRTAPFLRILREQPTGEDPYFITPPGSAGLRLRIEDDRQRNFQKLSTAALCLGLIGPEGEAALRELLRDKPPDLLPALLQAGTDLRFSDQEFVDICAECSHSSDEEIREAALFGLYFAVERGHPALVANRLFLWNRHIRENPFSLNAMWKSRVITSILADIVAENDHLDAMLLDALKNRETAEPALKVLAEMDESVRRFRPALVSFLDAETASRPTNPARHAFEAIRRSGSATAIPVLLKFLKGTNWFHSELAARTLGKIARQEPMTEILESALEKALFVKNLTISATCELVKAAVRLPRRSSRIQRKIGHLVANLCSILEDSKHSGHLKTEIVRAIGETGDFSTGAALRLLRFGQSLARSREQRENQSERFSEDYLLGEIIKALGKIGNPAPEIIGFLRTILLRNDELHLLARKAGNSLVQIGPEGHVALLELLKTTDDQSLEFTITWAFHRQPGSPIETVGSAFETATGATFDARYVNRLLECLRFNEQLGGDTTPLLLSLLNQPDDNIRLQVTDLLGRANDSTPEAIVALTNLLHDQNLEVACRARQSLRKLASS